MKRIQLNDFRKENWFFGEMCGELFKFTDTFKTRLALDFNYHSLGEYQI